ncbi:DUF1080 domain-containing protein [soil metagenome]
MIRSKHLIVGTIAITTAIIALGAAAFQNQDRPRVGFKDTPMLPGGKWHVHDGDRPQPPVVDPGTASTQDEPGKPPADAIVLFDGSDASGWQSRNGAEAGWEIEDGELVVKRGAGDILSRQEFGDCQLHLEFASPEPPTSRDQGRGNSGVMFFGRYEIQILDSFDNLTYPDGMASAIYGQHPPLVNASRLPGKWQTYDILFTAPRFADDGSLESPAYVTMHHNGVVVHNHVELLGPMAYRALPEYRPHGPKGPILLQDHGNPVRFRNIWVRELGDGGDDDDDL